MNPSFFATRSRSPALAGIRGQDGHVGGKWTTFFCVFLSDHAENICKFGLGFRGGASQGVAARERRQIGDESPVVIRSDDYRVAVQRPRVGVGHDSLIVIEPLRG